MLMMMMITTRKCSRPTGDMRSPRKVAESATFNSDCLGWQDIDVFQLWAANFFATNTPRLTAPQASEFLGDREGRRPRCPGAALTVPRVYAESEPLLSHTVSAPARLRRGNRVADSRQGRAHRRKTLLCAHSIPPRGRRSRWCARNCTQTDNEQSGQTSLLEGLRRRVRTSTAQ